MESHVRPEVWRSLPVTVNYSRAPRARAIWNLANLRYRRSDLWHPFITILKPGVRLRPSISKVGPGPKMTFDHDIRYDMTSRYRMFRPSISIASILITFDIKGCNHQYRTSTISKNLWYWSLESLDIRYRRSTISKKQRYQSSELRYRCIPISKISPYLHMLLRYLYTISKLLCFNIEFRVLQ
jgi:hypothetical protein